VDVFTGVKQLVKYSIVFSASYMFYDFFSRDRTSINTLVKIMLLLVVAVSFMTVASALESWVSGTPIYKRISLWFWNPNTLGTFIFVGIPIAITAGFGFIRSRGVRLFLLVIMLLALLFSSHRSSWVAASVSILYLLSKSRVKTLVLFTIIVGLFLSGLLLPVVGEDFYNYATKQQYTGRKEIWRASWHAIREHPFLGTGPGTSATTISEYMITPGFKGQDTHNSYLKNAVEMGFPSVLIVLVFYAVFLYYANIIERNLRSDYLRSVTRGTIATFLGLLFYDIFQNGFFMTVFGASEFTVIWPYVIAPLPFACERLDAHTEVPT
jgi:O-antigen ligase